VILAAGCKNSQISDLEFKKITRQRDSLIEASAKKDSSINAFLISFNEIENNLANIRARQESMAIRWSGGAELNKENVQKEIMEDIRVINDLLEQNQKQIGSLNAIIRGNDSKIQELNGMVNVLIQHIEDKNHELTVLNKTLSEKNKELAQSKRIVFHVPH
jgi:chromosome segregation ATPase